MPIRTLHRGFTPVLATILIAGCAATDTSPASGRDEDVAKLAAMLTGWFDNIAQAQRAPDDYFHIRLVMVPIWPERTDGRWLYVEQATASAVDRPYRQRVYRLHRPDDGALRSDVYTLPGDPLDFVACWNEPQPLSRLSPADLDLRDGCSIVFEPTPGDRLIGATIDEGCASTLSGAAYATSEVDIRPDVLVSWDRGWNATGEQVWGAVKGGYEFVRRGAGPPP